MQASTSGLLLASRPARPWSAAQPRSPSCAACDTRRHPGRGVLVVGAASGGGAATTNGFAEGAQRLATDASQRLKQFVKEHRLEEKAAEAGQQASRRLSEGWGEAQESWRRTSMKVDSEWELSAKARHATRQVRQAAADVDQRWGVRRVLRRAAAGVSARLPTWRRQAAAAAATPVGRGALLLAFLLLLSSGLLWQVIHLLWLVWVVSVPVGLYAANQARQGSVGRSTGGASGGGFGSNAPRSGGRGGGGRSDRWGDGPVIDAEYREVSR